ncbi:LysR substrate-binding domain-containing protein [Pseudomonas aeruginosa]|nr:LysR substrate-binding domain-containing protein [Pseudomonas aeruginosa]
MGAFMQRQPDCRVRLHVHNTAQVVQQVAHYELDLGLIEGDCRHPDIEVQPWMEDELVVFCAPASAGAAGRRRPGTADAGGLDPPRAGLGTRLTFDQASASSPAAAEHPPGAGAHRGDQACRGVRPGHRLHSRLALRDAFRRGSLVPVETPGLDLRRQFYFIWHKQKYQTATMREFLDLCRSETAGISRSDEIVLPLIP